MIEKVNPSHPDKVADRIAGAIVDLAYRAEENPKIAVEVLIGHGRCHAIIETTAQLYEADICSAITRIAGEMEADIAIVPQDTHLSENQSGTVRCGDNGIFKGMPLTEEQKELSQIAHSIYENYTSDGKYIMDSVRLIICQSNADSEELKNTYPGAEVNPIGGWTGGTDVDTGATNRKLGSDMADSVTGGGLHGKDLSKADVSVNIYAFLKAQKTGQPVQLVCAIGDDTVDGIPYADIVAEARKYIDALGVAQALEELGLAGKIKLVVCDSSEKQIQFLENGTIQACVVQNPFSMGYLSIANAVKLLEKQSVSEITYTDSTIVRKNDLTKASYQQLIIPFVP